jgi:uncharacterized protein (DUF433 family)
VAATARVALFHIRPATPVGSSRSRRCRAKYEQADNDSAYCDDQHRHVLCVTCERMEAGRGDVREELERHVQPLSARLMGVPSRRRLVSAIDRITIDPSVCGGRPCIRGLRVRVKDVLDLLAAGASRDEILADYPYLEDEDITALLEFAARQNDHPVLRSA